MVGVALPHGSTGGAPQTGGIAGGTPRYWVLLGGNLKAIPGGVPKQGDTKVLLRESPEHRELLRAPKNPSWWGTSKQGGFQSHPGDNPQSTGTAGGTPQSHPGGGPPNARGPHGHPGGNPQSTGTAEGDPKPFWASPRSKGGAPQSHPGRGVPKAQGPVGGTPHSTPGAGGAPSRAVPPKPSRPPRGDSHVLGGQVPALHDADGERAPPGHGGRAAERSRRSGAEPRTRGTQPRAHVRAGAASRQSARGAGRRAGPEAFPWRRLGDCSLP